MKKKNWPKILKPKLEKDSPIVPLVLLITMFIVFFWFANTL